LKETTVIPAQERHPGLYKSFQPLYVIPAFVRHPSGGWDPTFKKWILAFASMTCLRWDDVPALG